MTLQQIRYKLENLKGQRQQLAADRRATGDRIASLQQDAVDSEEARAVIQTVSQQTQKELEYHIGEIVSLALAAVFDDPYTLRLEFVQRRNRTEADILFERDGQTYRPADASGGGAVDVAALALRIAMWSLRRPRSRATLVMDEPMKMLSKDMMPKAAAMLAEVSKRLGLQIIIVSHSQELIEGADKWFTVAINKGVSHVSEGNASGEGQSVNRRDNGDTHDKQSLLDGGAKIIISPCAARNAKIDDADNQERYGRQQVVGAPRRRRT